MPLPTDAASTAQTPSAPIDQAMLIEEFVTAQADLDAGAHRLLAERRAQLEDAETLRRVRAL